MIKHWLIVLLTASLGGYVHANETPQRIVSAGGAVTEWIVALGAEKELVGVDTTSVYPESIRKLPKVGYQRQLSAEGVASLNPTLVVGTPEMGPNTVIKQLNGLGIHVETLSNHPDFKAVADNLTTLGKLLNKEKQAIQLYQSYHARFDHIQQAIEKAQNQTKPPKVILVMGLHGGLLAAGNETTSDWLIKQAGGENVALFDGYKSISSEALLALNPDVIIIADRSGHLNNEAIKKMISADPALALTNAAKQDKVLAIDATLLVAGLGPRLADETEKLAAIFYNLTTKQLTHANQSE